MKIVQGIKFDHQNRFDFAILLKKTLEDYVVFLREEVKSMFPNARFFPLFGREEGTFIFWKDGCMVKVYCTHAHFLKQATQINWVKLATEGDSIGLLRDKINSLKNLFSRMNTEIAHPTSLRIEVSVRDISLAREILKETTQKVEDLKDLRVVK